MVLDALYMEELNGPQQLMARAHAAAALRAAADHVVPANGSRKNNEIRDELIAIITELEALND